uniref:Transcription factor Adf-1 n=1 Tax=Apis cerana TaxID=7461 RepID=V9IEB7_APICE
MTMDLQRLITEVHARPAIWDQKNVNYHNRDVILKMWREIARACEVSTDVAKSKWKHLRDNFRNELKKTYRGKCDGGANEHDSKWVWFKSLFFLRDQMNSRVIGCTLSQNCSAALRSSPEETQIEPQIDILEGHEETQFDDLDGDSCQSLLSNDDGLHQVMPPPKMNKIGRKRSLMDAMENNYTEVDRKRFESLQKRLSVSQEEEDDTYHFLMSVRNPLKSLPLDRQMFIRLKIQELVYNEINLQNQQSRTYEVSQDVKPPRTGNASGVVGTGAGLGGGDACLGESIAGADTNGGGSGVGGTGGGGGGTSSLKSLKAAILPSSATIMQTNLPIGIFFVPAGIRIFAKYPSSGVSKPIVALSVSISASKSPSFNLSPSFLSQLTMVPVSIVGDNAGSCTFTWIG